MTATVAVVTDSTAGLPARDTARHGIRVVPLRVVAGEQACDDEPGALPEALAAEMRRGARLSTASPAPAVLTAAYTAAQAAGAKAVVSVHISRSLSGTVNSAMLAAASAPVPVRVVDSRSLGMGLGFAAMAAAEAASAGRNLEDVAAASLGRAARLRSFFVLDSLDTLSAGGRLDAPPPGGAPRLVARPLLHLADGQAEVLEKVRTWPAAIRRLEEVAAQFAAGRPVDLAVQHLGSAQRATALAGRLESLIPTARRRYLTEAGRVILAHTGPGMLGVVVAAL
jgi:DegV family protein with EDD domain